jgi:hypothetical protein
MNKKISSWIEEDRAEFIEKVTDGIVASLTFEEMRNKVWDQIYDELIHYNTWEDLRMLAEEFAPELLEN